MAALCAPRAPERARRRASPSTPARASAPSPAPGLQLPPGEPAINPVPRQMMREARGRDRGAAGRRRTSPITIAIPGGEALAREDAQRAARASSAGFRSSAPPASSSRSAAPPGSIRSIAASTWPARPALTHVAAATGSTSERAVQRALRSARDGAARHGRFRRRDAQVSPPASGAAAVARRRLRQAREAGARPSRPAFVALPARPADWRGSPAAMEQPLTGRRDPGRQYRGPDTG